MNKRIRELAEQAGFVLWPERGPFGEVIDWASNYDDELEKFAELVRNNGRHERGKTTRDKEDEARIKAYMEAKVKHIKMYNECMNLADGLDVEQFAELVRQDEREACAKLCDGWPDYNVQGLAEAIRARGEK